jgi:urea transporter
VRNGLYGYDGLLVGAAVGTFFSQHQWFLTILIVAPVVAVLLKINTQKFFLKIHLPQLTFPFVLTTWILFVLFPIELNSIQVSFNAFNLFFHSFSEVFLVASTGSSLLIFAGIAIGSNRSARWSIAGALSAVLISLIFNTEVYAFSAVLVSVALSSVYSSSQGLGYACPNFSIYLSNMDGSIEAYLAGGTQRAVTRHTFLKHQWTWSICDRASGFTNRRCSSVCLFGSDSIDFSNLI